MRDQLFEPFHLETTPPPVEDVRRRGDRRRRRTATAVAAGGMAAAIAVAAPFALAPSGLHRGEPQPAHTGSVTPTPTTAWVTTIPGSFDLTAGMATTPSATQEMLPDPHLLVGTLTVLPLDLGGCDAPLWEHTDPKATLIAQWTDHAGAAEVRSLSPYADGAAATAALDRIRQGVGGCPGGPLSPVPATLDGTALQGHAVAWVQPKRTGGTLDGTGTAYVVKQVGNVLVIDRAAMTRVGDPSARRLAVNHLAERLSDVVTAAALAFPSPGS